MKQEETLEKFKEENRKEEKSLFSCVFEKHKKKI
jgi:hypothetical protein